MTRTLPTGICDTPSPFCDKYGLKAAIHTHRWLCLAQLKATFLTIQCKECKNTKKIVCKPGVGGVMIPRYCDAGGAPGGGAADCGTDPFSILPNRSGYVDQQQLKLQARTRR